MPKKAPQKIDDKVQKQIEHLLKLKQKLSNAKKKLIELLESVKERNS